MEVRSSCFFLVVSILTVLSNVEENSLPDGMSFDDYFTAIGNKHDDDMDYSIFKAMSQSDYTRQVPNGTQFVLPNVIPEFSPRTDFNIAPFNADDEDEQVRQAIMMSLQCVLSLVMKAHNLT